MGPGFQPALPSLSARLMIPVKVPFKAPSRKVASDTSVQYEYGPVFEETSQRGVVFYKDDRHPFTGSEALPVGHRNKPRRTFEAMVGPQYRLGLPALWFTPK